MSTQTFRVAGSLSLAPSLGAVSGIRGSAIPLDELLYVEQQMQNTYVLDGDSPVSVQFGTLSAANAVFVKADGKVRVRLTSADGSQQSVPVDSVLLLTCQATGITAIDLTRVAGVDTTVEVFLGQKLS